MALVTVPIEAGYRTITQEVAASVLEQGALRIATHGILVACREPSPEEADNLRYLSPRQYEALEMASQGYEYGFIGAELGIAESTVKTHLKEAYTRLGGNNLKKLQAATFTPMALSALRTFRHNVLGCYQLPCASILTERELSIFNAMGANLTDKEVAVELKISHSTVRTHIDNITKKTDISHEYLARLSGAHRTAQNYLGSLGMVGEVEVS